MRDLYTQVDAAARSEAAVLIAGETGVGKELVARAIHAQDRRSKGPFVPVNAGALPETMLESELFGHTRGAYTGVVEPLGSDRRRTVGSFTPGSFSSFCVNTSGSNRCSPYPWLT